MQYVGQTINPLDRFKQHINDSKKDKRSSIFLYNAMKKYGIDSFTFEIIEENIPIENISERERYWINTLNTLRPNGYNLTLGGEGTFGYKHTEETKKKLSEMKKGRFTHIQTIDSREKISRANKGKKPSAQAIENSKKAHTGKVLTDEHKRKVSRALKNKPKSQHQKDALAEYWINLDPETKTARTKHLFDIRSCKVNMLSLDDKQVIHSFDSMRMAAEWIRNHTEHTKASHTRISFVCGDTSKSAYGFHWDYK